MILCGKRTISRMRVQKLISLSSQEYEDTENAIKIYFVKERFAVCPYPLEDRSD